MESSFAGQSSSLERYISEINRYSLLTKEKEFELARRLLDKDDMTAAHHLITSNLRFVVKVAYEFRHYGFKLLDLVQEGNIGLMRAVKKFNPEKGYRLISYAVWWIRAYIQNYIMRSWSLVKVGTTQAQKKLFFRLRGARNDIEREMQREGKGAHDEQVSRLVKKLEVKDAEIREMELRLAGRDFSLDVQIDEENQATHLDSLASDAPSQEDRLMDKEESHLVEERVQDALSKLNEKEKYIVQHRLMAENPLTLHEIGEKFHISRERVRQIENASKLKIKNFLLRACA